MIATAARAGPRRCKARHLGKRVELAGGEVARQRERRQVDDAGRLEQLRSSAAPGSGSASAASTARRSGRPRPRRGGERVDDPAAGQRVPRGMVAQHHPVAPQRADRLLEVELHKAALARRDRPRAEHRGAADRVRRCRDADAPAARRAAAPAQNARPARRTVDAARRQRAAAGATHPIAAAAARAPSGKEPATLTAQRSPAAARSTGRFCAWMPRTRTSMPRGLRSSRSPAATAPAATVPVTTSPIPGSEKARSIGIRNRPACRRGAAALGIGSGALRCRCSVERRRCPSPVRLDTAKIGLLGETRPRRAAPRASASTAARPLALDAVDLGDDPGDLGDADQLEDVEMLERLRPRPVIGGDDQQHPVDRQHPGQHVGQEALVARHVDKAELGAVGQRRIGEAEIDRQPAPLLLRQAVGIDPGQRAHQRGLAVVDMAGGGEDHRADDAQAASCCDEIRLVLEAAQVEDDAAALRSGRSPGPASRASAAPALRQRRRRRRRPASAPARRSAAATPAARRCRSGCWSRRSRPSAVPSSARATAGSSRCAERRDLVARAASAAAAPAAAPRAGRDRRRAAAPLRARRAGSCRAAARASAGFCASCAISSARPTIEPGLRAAEQLVAAEGDEVGARPSAPRRRSARAAGPSARDRPACRCRDPRQTARRARAPARRAAPSAPRR